MGFSSKQPSTGVRLSVYLSVLFVSIALFLTSCGGGGTQSTTPADFTISSAPANVTLVSGGSAEQISLSVVPVGGTTGAVSAKASPSFFQPVRARHNVAMLAKVISTALSVAPTGSVLSALAEVAVPLAHVEAFFAGAAARPNYILTTSSAGMTVGAGAAGIVIAVKAYAAPGFTSAVKVTISGLPAGVTASPATLTLTPGTPQSITIKAAASAAPGHATFTFTGTSGALSHVAKVYATITASQTQTPDYTLTASPATLTLTKGAAASPISVKATAANGFTGTVKVAIGGLPAGVTASPATLTLTPGTAQSVNLTAASSAALGNATLTFTGTSGTLIHSATVALAVNATPTPSFTLAVSPAALTLAAGTTGSSVSVKATAANGFAGAVKVAISGLPAGVTANPASFSLTPGTAQSTTLTAASSAAAASVTVTLTGTSGSLAQSVSLALTVQAEQTTTPSSAPDVTTFHYDAARDGLNAKETILTPTNVNSANFGKLGLLALDGKVDAQPLYLANLTVAGKAHNVLYVATEHGSLFAFDADNGTQLWKASILESGEVPSDSHNCGQIETQIGITSTPVIDRNQGAHGTIFAVGMSRDANGGYHQRLHAFDIATGAEISGSPTEITASYPGSGDNSQNGNVIFDPSQYAERAALLLSNGNIYTAWTSHCDAGLYTGWIIAYSESTLKQSQLIDLTPNGSQGAIWMAGDGLAADSSGDIYLLDANGTFDTAINGQGFPSRGDYGNAMLRLTTTNGKLAVADYFEPYNTVLESDDDTDLGSGGAILLPDQKDAGGTVHRLIVGAGKDKNIYLADRTNLGKYNPSTSAPNSNIYQQVTGQLAGGSFSTPAYFNGVLYYAAIGDSLKAFPLTNARLATSPSSHSAATFAYPGATPAVSANGAQNGIVWAVESHDSAAAVLHAYDPTNLGHEYYNSNQAPSGRDSFGNGNKFISPLIVNGKVYIGTQTGVAIFGLLTH